jgi:hypothetical protein
VLVLADVLVELGALDDAPEVAVVLELFFELEPQAATATAAIRAHMTAPNLLNFTAVSSWIAYTPSPR